MAVVWALKGTVGDLNYLLSPQLESEGDPVSVHKVTLHTTKVEQQVTELLPSTEDQPQWRCVCVCVSVCLCVRV
jgi:hypothetical protein